MCIYGSACMYMYGSVCTCMCGSHFAYTRILLMIQSGACTRMREPFYTYSCVMFHRYVCTKVCVYVCITSHIHSDIAHD